MPRKPQRAPETTKDIEETRDGTAGSMGRHADLATTSPSEAKELCQQGTQSAQRKALRKYGKVRSEARRVHGKARREGGRESAARVGCKGFTGVCFRFAGKAGGDFPN